MTNPKRCSRCREYFEVEEFQVSPKSGRRTSHCRVCKKEYLDEWRKRNAERLAAERRERWANRTPEERARKKQMDAEHYRRNPNRQRDYNLRKTFGISLQEYDAMLAQQDGVCAICGDKCPTGRSLAVDHDHATGAVRALLCCRCNQGLGNFRDRPDLLQNAAGYLARFETRESA